MENKEIMRDRLHCSGMASIYTAKDALRGIWDEHFIALRTPEDFAGKYTYLQELLSCCMDTLRHGVDLLEAENGDASELFLEECMCVVALNGPCGDVTEEQIQTRSGDVAQPQGTEGGRDGK